MHSKDTVIVRVSPFLDHANEFAAESAADTDLQSDSAARMDDESSGPNWDDFVSPFVHAEQLSNATNLASAQANEFVSLVDELHDQSLNDELYHLINELTVLGEQQVAVQGQYALTERLLERHIQPMEHDIEQWLDQVSERLSTTDVEHITDDELGVILDELDADEQLYVPHTEEFFKRLKRIGRRIKKKVKKVVKRAVKKAKRYAKKAARSALKRISGPLWKKLKRVAKTLLKRVVKAAIRKLPIALQPVARKLAGRFVKEVDTAEIYTFKGAESGSGSLKEIQQEFDVQLAYLVLSDDEIEHEQVLAEYEVGVENMVDDGVSQLDHARQRFVQRINELEEGEDPTPAIEEFIPAVLAGLRLGIRIIGRKRVVRFLAKYLARLIKRWVGKKYAMPLAKAITDLGLRLARLEADEPDRQLAGEAVAATLEETVRRVTELDDYVLEDQALLEGSLVEAFESAASANLPPVLSEQVYRSRPALRQSARLKGLWVMHPRTLASRHYKKYTGIIRREITPQLADMVTTWRGTPLSEFIKARFGIYGRPQPFRIHAYEAMPGTVLERIAQEDPDIRALHGVTADSFHPLTSEAAGVLLDEPGLGRDLPDKYLAEPQQTVVGQRYYVLEADPQAEQQHLVPVTRVHDRCCDTHVILDFVRRDIRVSFFLNEENAEKMGLQLKRGVRPGIVLSAVRHAYTTGIHRAFAGAADHRTRIIHGSVLPMQRTSELLQWVPPAVLMRFQKVVLREMDQLLLRELSGEGSRLASNAQSASLGLTLRFQIGAFSELALLGELFAGQAVNVRQWMPTAAPVSASVTLSAGFSHG